MQHRGNLPCDVVCVLHASVQSEPAGGREAVRGVSDEEEWSGLEALGHLRAHIPSIDHDQIDLSVRVSQSSSNQLLHDFALIVLFGDTLGHHA
ncbi:hypothetical protein FQZ97_1210000 [compost metagenome]